jgi:hypothetical protein
MSLSARLFRLLIVLLIVGLPGVADAQLQPAPLPTGPVNAGATSPTASPGGAAGSAGSMCQNQVVPATGCYFCGIFDALEQLATAYARLIFTTVAGYAGHILRIAFGFTIIAFCARLILFPREGAEAWPKFIVQSVIFLAAVALLYASQARAPWSLPPSQSSMSGQDPFIFVYIFDLFQSTALSLAQTIVSTGAQIAPSQSSTGGMVPLDVAKMGAHGAYSGLWTYVELVPYAIVHLASVNLGGWNSLTFSWVPWFILAVPYVFVLGIFAAFMVQTMFYFISIACVSPLLIAGLAFEKTRSYFFSALRILLAGSLTIVFAAVAMGFTGSILLFYMTKLNGQLGCAPSGNILTAINGLISLIATGINNYLPNPTSYIDQLLGLQSTATAAQQAQQAQTALTSVMQTSEYWMMFLVGFISVLLHLAAPRLAANIAGAQDSAVSAAAVVAGGQMLMAKGLGYAGLLRRGAFQAPAAAGQAFQALSQRFRGASE